MTTVFRSAVVTIFRRTRPMKYQLSRYPLSDHLAILTACLKFVKFPLQAIRSKGMPQRKRDTLVTAFTETFWHIMTSPG